MPNPLLTLRSFLVDQSYIRLVPVELGLTRLCLGYLNFPCLGDGVSESEMKTSVLKGCYSFLDYAALYWVDHLEGWIQEARTDESIAHIADLLQDFVQKYWSKMVCKAVVPQKIRDTFSCFELYEAFDYLTMAVVLWKKQRTSYGTSTAESESFDLVRSVTEVRCILEDVVSASVGNGVLERKLATFYGLNLYKCPRVSCRFFTDGFSTKSQRDHHLEKHKRGFNCTYPGCPYGTLGFKTQRELDKHIAGSHEEIQNGLQDFPVTQDPKSIDLRRAIRNGYVEEVEKWLEQFNGQVHFFGPVRGAFKSAIEKGDEAITKLLLKSLKAIGTADISQLARIALSAKQDEIATFLLDHDRNFWELGEGSPIIAAIEQGRDTVFRNLFYSRGLGLNGADADSQRNYIALTLRTAIKYKRPDTVRLLLEDGLCDTVLGTSYYPLDTAVDVGHEATPRMLLESEKCNVNLTNFTLRTPLHEALWQGH